MIKWNSKLVLIISFMYVRKTIDHVIDPFDTPGYKYLLLRTVITENRLWSATEVTTKMLYLSANPLSRHVLIYQTYNYDSMNQMLWKDQWKYEPHKAYPRTFCKYY